MPIILPTANDGPLTQGDILQGVKLFATRLDKSGGTASESSGELCLVLSRPCVAAHKSCLIVAQLRNQSPSLPKEVQSFDDALAFFTDTRDGLDTPDRFYIGSIPNYDNRFYVMLDRIFTVVLNERDDLRTRRIATLDPEFARDLHLRIFRSFASLGFDDVRWFSTEDLKLLIRYGKAEISALRKAQSDQDLAKGQQEFRGQQFKEKDLEKTSKQLEALELRIRPFVDELARRNQKIQA